MKMEEKRMYKNKLKNKIALCMTILILFVIIYSELFIIINIHHNCSGNNCPICAEIKIAEAMIQQFGSAVPPVMLLIIFVCFIAETISITNQVNLFSTPVEMKVRMDD